MASLNKVIILGNLGRDPEIFNTRNGGKIASLSLATTEKWTKDGEKHEKTEWHRVKIFSKAAEIVEKYVSKGDMLLVEGKIVYDKYTNKDGVEMTSAEVHVSGFNGQVTLMPKRDGAYPAAAPAAAPAPGGDFEVSDDDVPF